MKEYSYKPKTQMLFELVRLGGIVAIVFAVMVAALVVVIGIVTHADVGTILCWAGWMLLVGSSLGLGLANAYPTLWVSDDHLAVSAFLNGRIDIPWEEIVDVERKKVPFGGALIRARRISPIHRLYGCMYLGSPVPCIVVDSKMDCFEELLSEIEQRIRRNEA